jgi:hypothetical protein
MRPAVSNQTLPINFLMNPFLRACWTTFLTVLQFNRFRARCRFQKARVGVMQSGHLQAKLL